MLATRTTTLAVACVLTLRAAPAWADDREDAVEGERKACFDAYASGEKLQKSGQLIEAAKVLEKCHADTCPKSFKPYCVAKRDEVEQATPSIVVRYTDDTGNDRSDARLLVDGVLRTTLLDGKPVLVNPGAHRVRLELPDGKAPMDQDVVMPMGEKLRNIAFKEAVFRTVVERRRPVPWTVPVSLVVSGVGLVGFAVFGALSLSSYGSFDSCKATGTCDPATQAPFETRRTLADVGLAVSVVGLAAGAVFFFTRPTVTEQKRVRVAQGLAWTGGGAFTW